MSDDVSKVLSMTSSPARVFKQNPELIIFKGCMAGGKTTHLLSAFERYRYQHRNIIVFKPAIDGRFSTDEIVTHSGLRTPAITVCSGADILKVINDAPEIPDVIAVDEQFMIKGSAEALTWLFRQGFTVIVSTIDISFSGKPFEEVQALLPWATKVIACPAVCTSCGADALYTYKKTTSKVELEIGGLETYEPRCFSCHPRINQQMAR